MPLTPGSSRSVISKNISELTHHGTRPRSHEQIIAIALANARRHPRQDGGGVDLNYTPPPPNRRTFSRSLSGLNESQPPHDEEPPFTVEGTLGRGSNELRGVYRKNVPFADGGRTVPGTKDNPLIQEGPEGAPVGARPVPGSSDRNRFWNEHGFAPYNPPGVADDRVQKARRGGRAYGGEAPGDRDKDQTLRVPIQHLVYGQGMPDWLRERHPKGGEDAPWDEDVNIGTPSPPKGTTAGGYSARGGAINRAHGGAVSALAGGGAAIDRAVRSASRHAKQHLADGGMPEIPYFERQAVRDIEYANEHPGGLVTSAVPGRTDMHDVNVAAGSYVMPADVVSGLGEGNTLAGARVMNQILASPAPYGAKLVPQRRGRGVGMPAPPRLPEEEQPSAVSGLQSQFTKVAARGGRAMRPRVKAVPVVVAGGEYIVKPEEVLEIGGGDMKRGHAILDDFVLHARKGVIKTLRKLPGPVGAKRK